MRVINLILVFGLVFGFIPLAFAEGSSQELTREAARALAQGKFTQAIAAAEKCIELSSREAKKEQSKIKVLGKIALSADSKEVFSKYRILNDVGMSQFIVAEACRVQGKSKEANQAYKKVIMEYPESRNLLEIQRGKFVLIKLADEAKSRLKLDPQNKFYKLPIAIKVY